MTSTSIETPSPDPAGVFAVAHSLWIAVFESSTRPGKLALSDFYQGLDELMRLVLRIGVLFESWSCRHIAFDTLDEVWPYFIADNFGSSWLRIHDVYSLRSFNEQDCLRAAWHLGLPIRVSDEFVLPMSVRVANPNTDSPFVEFWIQTTRTARTGGNPKLFTTLDELFDEEYKRPCYSLYGRTRSGNIKHIASRTSYTLMTSLAKNLIPTVAFPTDVICRRVT